MHAFNILNLADPVCVQTQDLQVLVLTDILNFLNQVAIEIQMSQVRVDGHIVDFGDLVVRQVYPLEGGWGREVQHHSQLVGRSVKFDQMFQR